MGKGKILLIDDEPGVREFVKDFFEDREYNVVMAFDGLMGLEAFGKEEFDLVICDMLMPKMMGIDVLAAIKKLKPGQKVIMMSGVKEDSMVERAKALGCQHYITKPVRMADVEERVQECLSSS